MHPPATALPWILRIVQRHKLEPTEKYLVHWESSHPRQVVRLALLPLSAPAPAQTRLIATRSAELIMKYLALSGIIHQETLHALLVILVPTVTLQGWVHANFPHPNFARLPMVSCVMATSTTTLAQLRLLLVVLGRWTSVLMLLILLTAFVQIALQGNMPTVAHSVLFALQVNIPQH